MTENQKLKAVESDVLQLLTDIAANPHWTEEEALVVLENIEEVIREHKDSLFDSIHDFLENKL